MGNGDDGAFRRASAWSGRPIVAIVRGIQMPGKKRRGASRCGFASAGLRGPACMARPSGRAEFGRCEWAASDQPIRTIKMGQRGHRPARDDIRFSDDAD